jgi:hypothetical protein
MLILAVLSAATFANRASGSDLKLTYDKPATT